MNLCDLAMQIKCVCLKRLVAILFVAGLVSWTLVWGAPAGAEEKSDSEEKTVSEEILDILKEKG